MAKSIVSIISVIIFSSLAFYTPSTSYSSNQTDLLALLAIKGAIDVDRNGALNSWNRTTNFCTWNGITCGGRRHPDRVVGITLDSHGLMGSLSPHIGNLSFLRVIDLQNNSFSGPIPQEIGLLRRVEYIEFSNNSFMGRIFPDNISQWRNLFYLNLIDNNLSGPIPSEIQLLENLRDLGLGKNKISGLIPQFLGNLTSLTQLYLKSCGFEGEIPESLSQIKRLRFLTLGDNNLTGTIPPSLFNISTIESFVVDFNSLHGSIPSTIGLTLPNLSFLSLGKNQFSGRVPISLSNASSLENLVLSFNNFTGPMPMFGGLSRLINLYAANTLVEDDISLISSLTNCTQLQVLDLSSPLISGSIPQSIGNLSVYLEYMGIGGTQVRGNIPPGIENLVGLTVLYLSNSYLEGPIPLGIGKLFNLYSLNLAENRFTGVLPSLFGNLSSVTKLNLHGNNFSGAIPKSLGNCSNMLQLDLSENNFNGPIPQEILISTISISFNISHNALTGSIPVEVGSLKNLASLDFSNNRLSGLIPNSLGECISLERLHLEGNLFEGQIPEGLSSLLGLIDLDLSRNSFSGPIPSFFGVLRLQQLNLSFNMLQGQVPTTGIFRNKTVLSLQGNQQLCGGIVELDLPPCTSSSGSSKNKNISTPLKIVILVAGVATIMCVVGFLYYRRNISNKSPSSLSSQTGVPFLRLSYSDLLKATGGFAETNLVGFGRFGSVYRGVLDDGMKTIAVKVLNLVVKGASKSFLAECNALRHIRHRNLVKLLSVCESIDFQGNDFKALVYDFKANGSLDKWLYYNSEQDEENDPQFRNLDVNERLNIAIDVAHALEHLHCGIDSIIVHGDLKPCNILLDHDMTACVGDFGLAKIVSSTLPPRENSSTIGVRGTIGYVPPEYGMSNSLSTHGDVYSYGILVLEMFTNRRPTDDSLTDHNNLHNFVSAALPDRVMEVVDPLIRIGPHENNSKFEDCIFYILSIGLMCSKEVPSERISMAYVVNALSRIQKELSIMLKN